MERFSAALDLLEGQLGSRAESVRALSDASREIDTLRRDRERMLEEIERLKGEAEALETLTEEVSQRLDGTIREVRSILDVRTRPDTRPEQITVAS